MPFCDGDVCSSQQQQYKGRKEITLKEKKQGMLCFICHYTITLSSVNV